VVGLTWLSARASLATCDLGRGRSLAESGKVRRDLIGGELAAGRNPRDTLRALTDPPQVRTVEAWAEEYRAGRIDLAPGTLRTLRFQLQAITATLGDRDPATLTATDVQGWIAGLDLKPSSAGRYLATFRARLDFAGIDPNPARDPRVRLPREERAIVEPPSAEQVETIIARCARRWRLPLRVLEQTGMRVGELVALEWRDVDVPGSRFRIRRGKTATARRWVAVPGWLMEEIAATCPPDDRTAERHVFIGFNGENLRVAMARACRAAGIPHYHPHDLRHRYASVKVAEGVPITNVAAQLGHSRKSLTLGTFSHVLLDE
jgi:integrase